MARFAPFATGNASPMGERGVTTVASGVAWGAVAAMAMTGMRRMTSKIGLLERTPPERMAREGFPAVLARVPAEHHAEVIELSHWAYGAAVGATFAFLPETARRSRWAGPLYGVATWVAFDVVLRPLFGLAKPRSESRERVALLADHLLYGVVVAAGTRRV